MNIKILQLDYFELFDLPASYECDLAELEQRMHNLQQQYHPDNFTGDAELTSQAMIASSYINNAYQTLCDPLLRALYLLEYHGQQVDLSRETSFTPEFLLRQIELRERIGELHQAQDVDGLNQIEQQLSIKCLELQELLSRSFSSFNHVECVNLVKQLAFYDKLVKLVDEILSE